MELEFSRQRFEKYSNIKFHRIPSSGSELFHTDGRTDGRTEEQTDRQIDKHIWQSFIVAFRNFAKAPKNDENINNFPNSDVSEFNVRKNLNSEKV
jgi:hypothetical protein